MVASTRRHIDATVLELLQISEVFDHYGYQWWVEFYGYYAAVRSKGQCIFVIPEKNIVAVFTGDLSGKEAIEDPNQVMRMKTPGDVFFPPLLYLYPCGNEKDLVQKIQ